MNKFTQEGERDEKGNTRVVATRNARNILVAGILGIPIAGLGVVIGLMSVMKEMGFRTELIIAFTSLSFLLFLAAETVLVAAAKPQKDGRTNQQHCPIEGS
jgi:hypothetical protein